MAGRLDIDVEYVNDCKRLAKQCRLQDLIDDLETKCKKVYEFGKHFTASFLCCARGALFGDQEQSVTMPLGLPENDPLVAFPCLHAGFESLLSVGQL